MCEEVEGLAAGDRTPPQGWVHPRKDLKSIHIARSLACIESSSAEPPSTCQSVISISDPLMMTFPVFTIFILYMACIVCVVFERGRGERRGIEPRRRVPYQNGISSSSSSLKAEASETGPPADVLRSSGLGAGAPDPLSVTSTFQDWRLT